MAEVMDRIKEMGFKFATKSGTTIAMSDIEVPNIIQAQTDLPKRKKNKFRLKASTRTA